MISEKYSNHYSKFMGTYTFNEDEITEEIFEDFKNWKVNHYQGQVIFYQD
jgi:hypothetical protein